MIGSEEEEIALPNIPVQTIGLQTAKYLMGLLSNQSRINDGKANPIHVTLEVFNSLERRDIFNVVTRIEGSEEPDRYIIVGCRYDAWSYGAMEGNSGSSILLEVSSALSKLVSNDWKPRRTILLIHWDAGEMGEVGSTEWVEEHRVELLDRAVVYVNLDSCVTGLWSPKAEMNPLLRSFFVDLIPNLELSKFNSQFSNLFDFWISRNPSENDPYLPRIDPPSTASDQLPFLYYFGLPTIWPQLIDQFPLRTNRLRHTSLSSFQHVEQHVDPKFKGHELMTHLTLELIHKMSTSVKLPFDVREMAESLERDFNSLGADALDDLKTSLDQLQKAIREFSIASVLFHDNFQQLDENDRYVQMCNERLMKVSKSFVPRDLPRRNKRYFLSELSSSSVDSFGLFSMLRDSIENYLRTDSSSSSPSTPSSSSSSPPSSSSSSVVWKMESPAAPPSSSHSPFAETTSSSTVTTTNTFFGGRKTTSKWSRMLLLRQISATTLAIESATRILDFPEEYE